MGGRGCPGLLVEVRAGGIGTTRVTSSWSQTEDPREHSLGGGGECRGSSAGVLFLFLSSTSLWLPSHLPPPSCTPAQLYDPHGLQPARLLCPRPCPGRNTGVGGHALLHAGALWVEPGPGGLQQLGRRLGWNVRSGSAPELHPPGPSQTPAPDTRGPGRLLSW